MRFRRSSRHWRRSTSRITCFPTHEKPGPCPYSIILAATTSSGVIENLVAADAPPDDMDIARVSRSARLKGSPAIIGPGHLPDIFALLHPLDAQALPHATNPLALLQVMHQLAPGELKQPLFFLCEARPITPERILHIIRRHRHTRWGQLLWAVPQPRQYPRRSCPAPA